MGALLDPPHGKTWPSGKCPAVPRRGGGLTFDTGNGNSGNVVLMLLGSLTRVRGAGGIGAVHWRNAASVWNPYHEKLPRSLCCNAKQFARMLLDYSCILSSLIWCTLVHANCFSSPIFSSPGARVMLRKSLLCSFQTRNFPTLGKIKKKFGKKGTSCVSSNHHLLLGLTFSPLSCQVRRWATVDFQTLQWYGDATQTTARPRSKLAQLLSLFCSLH